MTKNLNVLLKSNNSIFFSINFRIGYACIVDVGDQKTSVSCVEDGISHPDTRMHLDYGGSDITQVNIISFSAS